MRFELNAAEVFQKGKSKNVIYCDEDKIIRIGDVAANIITSMFINYVSGLQAPYYAPCTVAIAGHEINACYTTDVYKDVVTLQFLTSIIPHDLQDISEYVDVLSSMIKEYLSIDIHDMIVKRTQLAYLLSSVIMPVDNIVLKKTETGYIDEGIVLGVGFGFNITENSNRNFLAQHSGRKELLTYFYGKEKLIIDYDAFKEEARMLFEVSSLMRDDIFRLRCEYILRVIDMVLMDHTEGIIWTRP